MTDEAKLAAQIAAQLCAADIVAHTVHWNTAVGAGGPKGLQIPGAGGKIGGVGGIAIGAVLASSNPADQEKAAMRVAHYMRIANAIVELAKASAPNGNPLGIDVPGMTPVPGPGKLSMFSGASGGREGDGVVPSGGGEQG